MFSSSLRVNAFALLGPFEPWMTATNGFYPTSGDIGGPMALTNEYRWNVPVVTYGFDQSFIKFFGSNGITAVQNAIQILNDLPPASQIDLGNFPYFTQSHNHLAESKGLNDLKSTTLFLLLEQLGLARPSDSVFVLRRWNPLFVGPASLSVYGGHVFFETNWTSEILDYNIVTRNYDSATRSPSDFVNGVLYAGEVFTDVTGVSSIPLIVVDPSQANEAFSAVADQAITSGTFYKGITRDDAAGLNYLYSPDNINYETLLSSIVSAETNGRAIVNGAWRPGVDKINFIPHTVDAQSGAFMPMTNFFTDHYLTNGVPMQQQVARIISRPDFLFCAGDIQSIGLGFPMYNRTGTTNWLNNAVLNGNTNGAGPGVIQPSVKIVFNKLGTLVYGENNQVMTDETTRWGSFDATTNAPVNYPVIQSASSEMTFRLWLFLGGNLASTKHFDWNITSATGITYQLQTSTNLKDWIPLFSVTNNGALSGYVDSSPINPSTFYRLIPK